MEFFLIRNFLLNVVQLILLQKRRPPQFFSNLKESLRIMIKNFKCGNTTESCSERETLESIERTLRLHSYETSDLIHQYYIEQHQQQLKMNNTPYGQLTIRCKFTDDQFLKVIIDNNNSLHSLHSADDVVIFFTFRISTN